jgi:hypothetical protein
VRARTLALVVALLLASLAVAPSARAGTTARSEADRRDDRGGPQIHAIYLLPSDAADLRRDTDGSIERSVQSFDRWLRGQTGGTGLRLDTFRGHLDVTFHRLRLSNLAVSALEDDELTYFETELRLAGKIAPNKLYAIWYEGMSDVACGQGAHPPENPGRVVAQFMQSWPASSPRPCPTKLTTDVATPGYREFAQLHELFHGLGAVPSCAPHAEDAHTNDWSFDLMYSGPKPWYPSMLDPGRDDYFGHGRRDCLDLARSAFLDPQPARAELPPGWSS